MDIKHLKLVKTGWRRYVFIELPIFFASLANGMITNVFIDLIVYQSCRQIITRNDSICDVLHTNSSSEEARELNKIVQPHASYIIMCKLLIESILPAIFILFLGPWSDKYGRKPLLTVGYFGKVFSLVTFMETILPLGSAPLYSLVYSSSISVYPSPVYMLTSGIFLLMIIINIVVNVKFVKHESINQSTVLTD